MCKHFTKEVPKMQRLKDRNSKGKERPWRENKVKSILLAESYKRLGKEFENKYYRVVECATYLEFKIYIETGIMKLYKANFCKVRLCPMCSWRRAKKIFAQVSKIMDKALEDKDYRFIFLTLTCENVDSSKLSSNIDNLFKSFDRLFKRTAVKKAVKGWFRAFEVTHNLDKQSLSYDTYHSHFHVILMVNKSYFTESNLYLSQEDWTNLWKESMKVDYTPIVDVRIFKTDNEKSIVKAVAEAAKYAVKDNDYILPKDEKMTDNSVATLDRALANRRLVAYGGRFKELHKELKLDDPENGNLTGENDPTREDVGYMVERYSWHVGYKQYYKAED